MVPSQKCINKTYKLMDFYKNLIDTYNANLEQMKQLEEKQKLTEQKVEAYKNELLQANEKVRVAEARAMAAEQTLENARQSDSAQGGREEDIATLKFEAK